MDTLQRFPLVWMVWIATMGTQIILGSRGALALA